VPAKCQHSSGRCGTERSHPSRAGRRAGVACAPNQEVGGPDPAGAADDPKVSDRRQGGDIRSSTPISTSANSNSDLVKPVRQPGRLHSGHQGSPVAGTEWKLTTTTTWTSRARGVKWHTAISSRRPTTSSTAFERTGTPKPKHPREHGVHQGREGSRRPTRTPSCSRKATPDPLLRRAGVLRRKIVEEDKYLEGRRQRPVNAKPVELGPVAASVSWTKATGVLERANRTPSAGKPISTASS